MVEFHRRLKLKFDHPRLATTKAEALRQAQLKVRSSAAHQHPFYWAGFIIAGDAR
jgi:CHAT domain-containing protein